MITDAQRKQLATDGQFFHANRQHLLYRETRPLPLFTKAQLVEKFARGETVEYDCSWLFEQLCDMVGLPSPSGPGEPYKDGEGNTTTIFDYLPHIREFHEAGPVDFSRTHTGTGLGFLPGPGPAHITMIAKADPVNPLLISWGYQGAPVLVTYDEERVEHPGQTVVLLEIDKL